MNYLLIDTSNQPLSVAVVQDKETLSEINTNIKKNHSIQLMPSIKQVIADSGLDKSAIDGIVVAKGPGSYTGLRIGVTVAKTLAYAMNAKLYGVSSLKALAATAKNEQGLIVPVFDARREAVYTGVYKYVDQQLVTVIEDQYLPITQLLQALHELGEDYTFVGPDTDHLQIHLDGKCVANIPKAKYMIEMLESPENVHEFTPNYIKLSEAERNWLNQQNKN
ncbi:tRNA (adenosine(37)-N6)-threonylcarbamoyltransferase complex dimerization subunit type 1 TsaB [Staphylococcus gallinarum]|uniref:tRNA (adenosine(37)-N6)-threonylcarbamoyltransferase complex dimerization subunit type 1 TsaB n=1 Tax=Staphylococcus gallinarum TaxID=1293 RepID=UPI001E29A5D6|nr:tRNA (adenosine(37)-N6)-threonylcarbamoyltransferase complex dimerization subunit type 1 TsaB [Staphylococcus gallinarum]